MFIKTEYIKSNVELLLEYPALIGIVLMMGSWLYMVYWVFKARYLELKILEEEKEENNIVHSQKP